MRVPVSAQASIVALFIVACGSAPATNPTVATPTATRTVASSAATVPAWMIGLGGRIVFSREGGDPKASSVYSMAPDGSGLALVTESPTSVTDVIWGPADRFLFNSDRSGQPEVFSMDGRGGEIRPVTTGPDAHAHVALSHDGTTVAYEAWTDVADLGIHLAPVDGSASPTLLTPPADPLVGGDGQPAFSPDGRLVAFQRVVDHSNEQAVRAALFVIGVDGKGLRQLTPEAMDAGHPRWSPDGRTILFHDNADMQGPVAGKSANLWTMAPDGTGLTQLTHETGGNYAIEGTWSPDGTAIAFASWFGADEFTAIRVMHADGTGITPVWTGTFSGGSGNDPEWSASR